MTAQNANTVDISWTVFIEILSDEFTAKTGVGVYAHITPIDIDHAYQQYLFLNAPMRKFVHDYVRTHAQ